MVGLSLLDKSHRIENPLTEKIARNKAVKMGWMIIGIAALVGIIAAFFVVPLKNLALEAVYVLVAGFILIGAIIILNETKRTMDEKGIIVEKILFKTTGLFNAAAIGICGILAALYYFFW